MEDSVEIGEKASNLDRLGYTFRLISGEDMHEKWQDSWGGILTEDYRHQGVLTQTGKSEILLNKDVLDPRFLEFYAEHEARELWIRNKKEVADQIKRKADEARVILTDDRYDKDRSLNHHIAEYYAYLLAQQKGILDEFVDYDMKIRNDELERVRALPGPSLKPEEINAYLVSMEIDKKIGDFIKAGGKLE